MKKNEDYNYFDEFIRMTDCILESAITLDETLKKFEVESLEKNINQVHKYENEADQIVHNTVAYIIKDFIPPIDREDITHIIRELDDIEDYIDELLIDVKIYNITEIREDALKFTELLMESTNYVKMLLEEFKNFKKKNQIQENIIKINDAEDRGDRQFENSMKKLYTECKDAIEIVKWSNLYNCFENTIDACEHLADSIEDVVMKNS